MKKKKVDKKKIFRTFVNLPAGMEYNLIRKMLVREFDELKKFIDFDDYIIIKVTFEAIPPESFYPRDYRPWEQEKEEEK